MVIKKINLGKLKYLADRQRNYWYYINTIMITYLFIDKAGWSWWYLLIIPGVMVSIWLDVKYVLKSELDYSWNKSPAYHKLLNINKLEKK